MSVIGRIMSAVAATGVTLGAVFAIARTDRPVAAADRHPFDAIGQTLSSPRCMNCHPRGDRPMQGPGVRPHPMNVQRGRDDRGRVAMRCTGCHGDRNNERTGIPGVHDWRLAPATMGWVGRSAPELCRMLKDRKANGNRDIEALAAHMTSDPFILWAWHAGRDRAPPPLPFDAYRSAVQRWVAAGAPCPK
jgi:hypothetical protein